MAEQLSESQLTSMLEGAFDAQPAPAPVKAVRDPSPPDDEEPQEAVQAEEATDSAEPQGESEPVEAEPVEKEPVAEPEFEIEVDGKKEVVRGREQIKEMLQKAKDYTQKSEFNARARDALAAQAHQIRMEQEFNRAIFDDIAQLRAMDAQLAQYQNIDWSAAIDSDFTNAMKLQEQRNALREARNAKAMEIGSKQQAFQQNQAQAVQQKIAAENAALLAKLPEWRNSETRTKEQQAIAQTLANSYGFNEAEIAGLQDHRMALVARDAMKWRALQAEKSQQTKQVRTAPPAVKPGANAQPQAKGQAAFKTQLVELRKAGRQGNHRAQERLVEKMFERTFK